MSKKYGAQFQGSKTKARREAFFKREREKREDQRLMDYKKQMLKRAIESCNYPYAAKLMAEGVSLDDY